MQLLEGISDIRDESDRTGMRVVIEVRATIFYFYLESKDFNILFFMWNTYFPCTLLQLKRSADPAIVLNNLYRHTALQSSFSCNMVA